MTMENVQTLDRNETKLVGYTVTASLNQDLESSIIGTLRKQLLDKRHEIANQLDVKGIYLVQVYTNIEWTPDVPFVSVVAVEVSDFDHVTEGFVRHVLPAGKYVKATHRGPESQIGETYDSIRETDLGNFRPFVFDYWTDFAV